MHLFRSPKLGTICLKSGHAVISLCMNPGQRSNAALSQGQFLGWGKTTSLWWNSDACRLCDLHIISCNLLFCLTGSIPFVSRFWTLTHGNQSNCYNMGKCGLDYLLIQQSSTIRKSKAHIAFCISYNYKKKMIIKNFVFLFYSYITPTSQFPLRLSRGRNSNKSDHCLLISLPFNDWCRK